MCERPETPSPRDSVALKDGRVTPTPEQVQHNEAVRAKLAALNLTESNIAEAVDWARRAQ